ncbi:sugar phosphate isomerase/epimerase family protein [Robertkochia solimangrovi]|uniref:sugar phosphate isomerase/epimerase family protein n=1 Tax=Robertkochia solimangrovi TaxID=2213046 RepID=UPI00117FBD68|nr:sugar phosphate isomerase/epimerase family protein [Robertkochia solimangrovi]TRZ43989.1 hypothetical protein DMZ48_08540 [Robertkochia solimangrovi]
MTNNKPKVGVITWTYGIKDLETLFSSIKSTGFEAIQFSGDHKFYDPVTVVTLAKKYELDIRVYDPMNYKPCNEEQFTLKDCVSHYQEIIAFAVAIGAPVVTLQGISYWTKEIGNYEKAMDFIIEAVRQLDLIAQNEQITLSYEACNHYELPWVQTAEELLRIYRESKAKNLLLVLDSFHMNICESDMHSPLLKIGDLLHSYHISDSGRGGIGTGHIDYTEQYRTLKEIGFEGYVFFEFVLPEIRPYKYPMNKEQMQEFLGQCRRSLTLWTSIIKN